MNHTDDLPAVFLQEIEALEASYLAESDPIRQSGFGGGAVRWRREREPILNAITQSGELLDTGCANGYLLESLMIWGKERGLTITPYGLDVGAGLIALARQRLPEYAGNFLVGNAWSWQPDRPFANVYLLLDQVPHRYLTRHLQRLMDQVVAPRGRLIAGSYGSCSRGIPAADVAAALNSAGLTVVGTAVGGDDAVARFAWADRLE
jgi:hypothetical protein